MREKQCAGRKFLFHYDPFALWCFMLRTEQIHGASLYSLFFQQLSCLPKQKRFLKGQLFIVLS